MSDESKWTPEPWRAVEEPHEVRPRETRIGLRGGPTGWENCWIASFGSLAMREATDESRFHRIAVADARRAAACVNACAGIADPAVVPELVALVRRAYRWSPWERASPPDGLLTTDEPWVCCGCGSEYPFHDYEDVIPEEGTHSDGCAWTIARALLARVDGGAS